MADFHGKRRFGIGVFLTALLSAARNKPRLVRGAYRFFKFGLSYRRTLKSHLLPTASVCPWSANDPIKPC